MMDIGCHGMDLIHTVAGSSIEECCAHLSRGKKRRGIRRAPAERCGKYRHPQLQAGQRRDGVPRGFLDAAQTNRFEMEIYGAKGVIYLYNPHRSDIVYYGWNLDGHPARISTGRPPPSTRSSLGTFITRHLWTICERHEQQQNSARRICAAPGGRGRPALLESGRIERVLGI
ncbi:MAG: hypothetical protein ACLRRT_13065 [Ruthenibacterium lactatiformans]